MTLANLFFRVPDGAADKAPTASGANGGSGEEKPAGLAFPESTKVPFLPNFYFQGCIPRDFGMSFR